MVDWDDIRLSDPMQDIGLLLWWYVAQERWQDFFQNYGLPMEHQLTARIFWWAARSSFAIALWHIEHHYDCTPFLKDFIAAIRKESNPHAVFRLRITLTAFRYATPHQHLVHSVESLADPLKEPFPPVHPRYRLVSSALFA